LFVFIVFYIQQVFVLNRYIWIVFDLRFPMVKKKFKFHWIILISDPKQRSGARLLTPTVKSKKCHKLLWEKQKWKKSKIRFDHQHTAILATGYPKLLNNSTRLGTWSVPSSTHLLDAFQQGTWSSTLYVPKSTLRYFSTRKYLWHTSSRVLFRVPLAQYIH